MLSRLARRSGSLARACSARSCVSRPLHTHAIPPSLSAAAVAATTTASAYSIVHRVSKLHARSFCASRVPEALHTLNHHSFNPKEHLDAQLYVAFHEAATKGKQLNKEQKSKIAAVIRKWATDRGAINFSHWFSPMRGAIHGEKQDAFLELNPSTGSFQVELSGSRLFMGETDGSSFPNGGLRATHRAAAYVSWDLTSYPFIRHNTLYIPAAFVSFTGEPLDYKTPLLRSQDALTREGIRVLRLLGDKESNHLVANVGWEQEFFVVNRALFLQRPDLATTGRTLIGALPPLHQQMESNYFARQHLSVRAFLAEVQSQLWQMGVSMNVQHTEVAPAQHELSPIFTVTSRGADQNSLTMNVLDEVAEAFGLAVLMHEKPFKGINGSGKHNNWGLNTDTGSNLFLPGASVFEQQRFMVFVAAVARALDLHGDVIRMGVATAGNDHRLGAHEAPPAIISLYTGEGMESHIKSIIAGGALEGYGRDTRVLEFGTSAVQHINAAKEDRNRTAPFPFCGNRFEFRAVGANQNVALPLFLLNTAMADALGDIADMLEQRKSVRDVVAQVFKEHTRIIFNGNGYDPEWHAEAEQRGIRNLRNTPDAIDAFNHEKNVKLFTKHKILSAENLHARVEVMYEQYIKTILVEAHTLLKMVNTTIMPALVQDTELAPSSSGTALTAYYENKHKTYDTLGEEILKLQEVFDELPESADLSKKAHYCLETILPQMSHVRSLCDQIEQVCSKNAWPYPTYEDLLFSFSATPPNEQGSM